MIRPFNCIAGAFALVAFSLSVPHAVAQQDVPAAPPSAVTAPAPTTAPVFPKPDPANFTAAVPTTEAVNGFLQASWGYDQDRMWQVQAILKTPAEGVSKVIILVGDKSGKQKSAVAQFFVLPDGKHLVAQDEILPFGDQPFTETRTVLKQRADGPYRGSAMKDLELVEFADYQCPHCKDAQANMDKLAVDFPKARFVYQNYPLKQHPAAEKAAAYGLCVAKLGGSDAFFTFSAAVYEGQEGLATTDGATLTLNSAATKAGMDPEKVGACAATPETMASVQASVKLAQDLNINQTPTLVINGRPVPANAPYDTLKQIILYQAKLDGVVAQ